MALYAAAPCQSNSRLRVKGLRPTHLAMNRMLPPRLPQRMIRLITFVGHTLTGRITTDRIEQAALVGVFTRLSNQPGIRINVPILRFTNAKIVEAIVPALRAGQRVSRRKASQPPPSTPHRVGHSISADLRASCPETADKRQGSRASTSHPSTPIRKTHSRSLQPMQIHAPSLR